MKTSTIRFAVLSLLLLAFVLLPDAAWAQCPMCRMTVESNYANGGGEGRGLNNGILYMLATPYVLIGLIAYFWWKNKVKEEDMGSDVVEE
jgi:hypothetical protein